MNNDALPIHVATAPTTNLAQSVVALPSRSQQEPIMANQFFAGTIESISGNATVTASNFTLVGNPVEFAMHHAGPGFSAAYANLLFAAANKTNVTIRTDNAGVTPNNKAIADVVRLTF